MCVRFPPKKMGAWPCRLCLFASVVPPFINDGAYVKSAWGGRQSMARAISTTSYEATGK